MCQDTIINNRLDISICLDTGASASCIREEVYRKLKIGKPLTHAKIKVTGIGESSIRNRPISLGKVRLKLQFKGRKGKNSAEIGRKKVPSRPHTPLFSTSHDRYQRSQYRFGS